VLGCIAVSADPILPPTWQANTWHGDDITLLALVSQIGMSSSPITLDLPGWSLVHELRITLLFPLLLLLLRRAPATTIGVAFCVHFANWHGPLAIATLIPDTAAYIVYFAAGAGLALYGTTIGALCRATILTRSLLVVTSLLLLSVPSDNRWSGIIAGAGAVSLIAVVTASPEIGRVLSASWCAFLGRVSYSLYLTHVVVLTALGTLLGAWFSVWLILLIATPLIGLVAWMSYQWVERPSIRMGRSVAAGM
jgi:peptidoglycan/LPS O-acetylase OafA/YrhL